MLIRPPELEIPENDPFRNDALERAKLEPPLTEFVSQALGSFVLAIDGGWGTGKTTFIRMWQRKLEQRGYKCLYFNAWETDFAADPLVALVGELSAAIKGAGTFQAKKKLKVITTSILRRSIPVAVRLVTQGFVNLDDVTEEQLGDLASKVAEDQIENYEKSKSDLAGFRRALQTLVKKIAPEEREGEVRIVVFVDELDRCRPSYAVELLERIKHLFDVAGIVFVLGVDRQQLAHSVRVLYGSGFEAERYLRRFIDVDYRLPDPPRGIYYKHLYKVLGIEALVLGRDSGRPREELAGLQEILGALLAAANLSLQEQLQIVSRLRIVLQTIPRNEFLFEEALGILVFLRGWDSSLYHGIRECTGDLENVLAKFDTLQVDRFRERYASEIYEAVLLAGGAELGLAAKRLDRYQALVKGTTNQPEREKAERIVAIIQELSSFHRRGVGFKPTLERIELAKPFVAAPNPP